MAVSLLLPAVSVTSERSASELRENCAERFGVDPGCVQLFHLQQCEDTDQLSNNMACMVTQDTSAFSLQNVETIFEENNELRTKVVLSSDALVEMEKRLEEYERDLTKFNNTLKETGSTKKNVNLPESELLNQIDKLEKQNTEFRRHLTTAEIRRSDTQECVAQLKREFEMFVKEILGDLSPDSPDRLRSKSATQEPAVKPGSLHQQLLGGSLSGDVKLDSDQIDRCVHEYVGELHDTEVSRLIEVLGTKPSAEGLLALRGRLNNLCARR